MSMQFADLIRTGLGQEAPMRLLFLFVKIEALKTEHPGAGTLAPVMVTDKLIEPDLTFDELVAEADGVTPNWDFVLISTLSRADGNIPETGEAEPHLQQMANTVVAGGDLSHFMVYDRDENPIRIETTRAGSA